MNIKNKNDFPPQQRGIFPEFSKRGNKLPSAKKGMITMDRCCCGIRNYSGAEIIVDVILTGNEEDNTITAKIPDGSRWSDGPFNAIKTANSVGYDGNTVYYLFQEGDI